ncbi:Proteophosphoglycan 5 [Rhodotorula toruloides ATCC 204091]|uniref:G-patch domain-containing protein n=1 Tax=Rhodotorula toruloides TaxID=5286 RepID=A0A2T0A117_RHOTO|nr:Proteophosphoglycan 5 [Rhodotorula toruloides ATCC 204091]PRQ71706.1 hypothetical protein AAT19DRAFT_9821 [Rhodotorula toruloides]
MAYHPPPPPRFIFSFNEADPDVATLPAPQKAALGFRRAGLGQRRTQYDGDDERVPDYGPTTKRRGRMRFVPAKSSAFGVIPASEDGDEKLETGYEGKGKGKAVEDVAEQDVQADGAVEEIAVEPAASTSAGPSVQRRAPIPGSSVRGLYESIVGLSVHSAPASTNPSPSTSKRSTPSPPSSPRSAAISSPSIPSTSTALYPVSSASSTSSVSSQTLKRSASPPSSSLAQHATTETADIVLSSDSEDEDERPARRIRRDKRVKEEDSDSDDLVVIDPLTNLPEVPFRRSSSLPLPSSSSDTSQPSTSRGTSSQTSPYGAFSAAAPSVKRLQPLLIHQLLPPAISSSSDTDGKPAGFKPLVPPTHYAIRPDSPGWQLLARQGWKEGQTLGPVTPEGEGRGLKVPLRPVEKHDRKGLGLGTGEDGGGGKNGRKLTHEESERERRRKEREERDKRGRGERGMERMKKREERERKAMIAYMNR